MSKRLPIYNEWLFYLKKGMFKRAVHFKLVLHGHREWIEYIWHVIALLLYGCRERKKCELKLSTWVVSYGCPQFASLLMHASVPLRSDNVVRNQSSLIYIWKHCCL